MVLAVNNESGDAAVVDGVGHGINNVHVFEIDEKDAVTRCGHQQNGLQRGSSIVVEMNRVLWMRSCLLVGNSGFGRRECGYLVVSNKGRFSILCSFSSINGFEVDSHCVDAAVISSTNEGVRILNKAQSFDLGTGSVAVSVTGTRRYVLLQTHCIPYLASPIIRGGDEERMIWSNTHSVDCSRMFRELGEKLASWTPGLIVDVGSVNASRILRLDINGSSNWSLIHSRWTRLPEIVLINGKVLCEMIVKEPQDVRIVARI